MYYKRLDLALDATLANCEEMGVEVNASEVRTPFEQGGISYGEVQSVNVEINKLKGRNTRKWYHVVITRMDSGNYELVNYIL